MTSPNADMGELATVALKHYRKPIADAITGNNALLAILRSRKHIETIDGGTSITSPIEYSENPNFTYYSGLGRFPIQTHEHLTSVEEDWSQWAVAVTLSGLDSIKVSGKAQIIPLMAAKMKNARRTLANQMSEGVYSDGTGSGGLQLTGLQAWVADAAGATVGDINSTTYTWWDNKRATSTGMDKVSAYREMLSLYLACSRGSDQPDLIVADNTFFRFYSEGLHAQQRFMDKKMAEAGFRNNLMFQNAPVVYDGGIGGDAPVGMYFLNSEFIKFCIARDRNNVVLDGPKRAVDQDATTNVIAGAGNIIVTNRQLMGRLT